MSNVSFDAKNLSVSRVVSALCVLASSDLELLHCAAARQLMRTGETPASRRGLWDPAGGAWWTGLDRESDGIS